MRAKLLAVASVLVLGLAACGNESDTADTEVVEPPAAETGVGSTQPVTPLPDEPATAADPAVELEDPEVAGPTTGTTTEPAGDATVTTYGGAAGPTTTTGGETTVIEPDETEEQPATPPPAGGQ